MQTLKVDMTTAGVARIQMARPEVFNAFDERMIDELDEAFSTLGGDPTVRVIVLSGRGKAFSAGADLQWMKRASEASQEWNLADARRFATMLNRIESCPKPTIAQVHGTALGGGVGLICACDIAIASTDATFAVTEARFGILPAVIGPYLTNAVGKRHARRLALTTSRITADEAIALNLVDKIVAPEELAGAVTSSVSELLQAAPKAQAEIKSLFARLRSGPIDVHVRELTAQTISRVRMTDEAKEGFAAFLAKRPASWTRAD